MPGKAYTTCDLLRRHSSADRRSFAPTNSVGLSSSLQMSFGLHFQLLVLILHPFEDLSAM
ncbi:hypothetical protein ACVIJW_008739 [Bradyrhizobium barranii subsp. barranii]